MTLNHDNPARISSAYLRRLRGLKRGPLPERNRDTLRPSALLYRAVLVAALSLVAALVWLLALAVAS